MSQLANYACFPQQSIGRAYAEQPPTSRTQFQRDRDRIIHCSAFRRLEYKTQVFVNHEGDLFRTRLTHSLEVAQIARSLARNLRVNEDLVEAISLAHDLGHTPFGHAGQDQLHACVKQADPDMAGFEHNLQSLRIVDKLEQRYASFEGLNLCFETREGILKHCSPRNARKIGDVARRFLEKKQPSIEAQIANLADEIAYNNHDVDDGLRSGLITIEQLLQLPLFAQHYELVKTNFPKINKKRLAAEIIRSMINALVIDLTQQTLDNLNKYNPNSVEDVRNSPRIVQFSPEMREKATAMKTFLYDNLYRHYKVVRMSNKATIIIRDLFEAFLQEPRLLSTEYRFDDKKQQIRAITDYIAGMTDRFAIKEHNNLFKM